MKKSCIFFFLIIYFWHPYILRLCEFRCVLFDGRSFFLSKGVYLHCQSHLSNAGKCPSYFPSHAETTSQLRYLYILHLSCTKKSFCANYFQKRPNAVTCNFGLYIWFFTNLNDTINVVMNSDIDNTIRGDIWLYRN